MNNTVTDTSGCSGCSGCGGSQRSGDKFCRSLTAPHRLSDVKRVVGIIGGRSGAGSSFVTALLAAGMRQKGMSAAILDADIHTGTMPDMFEVTEKAVVTERGILPVKTKIGVELMSAALLFQNDAAARLSRSIAPGETAVHFWTHVIWRDAEVLFVDLPAGSEDTALAVFRFLPLDGLIVVLTPQHSASSAVEKITKTAEIMKIPVLGAVENMVHFECPCCSTRHRIFGGETAREYPLRLLARLPIDPALIKIAGGGHFDIFPNDRLDSLLRLLIDIPAYGGGL